jgi:hypothetical protein
MTADTEAICGRARVALAAWDPEADLDEGVAVHVGGCAPCRALFDARFPPAVDRSVAVPRLNHARAPSRAPSHARSRRSWMRGATVAAAVAVVAAVVTAMGLRPRGAEARGELLPPECPVEVAAVAMECPPA